MWHTCTCNGVRSVSYLLKEVRAAGQGHESESLDPSELGEDNWFEWL